MARDLNLIKIEDTRFIFKTNFSGDPERDDYGSSQRKANVIIPTKEQADDLAAMGFNVKCTKPKDGEEEGFEPTYFVAVRANFNSAWPPKIKLVVSNEEPIMLDEESVGILDNIYVLNVNVLLSPYYNERNNRWSLYIKTMYVEQDMEDDPFASRYRRNMPLD